MNIQKRLIIIFFLFLILLLDSCDVLIKKNEEEFIDNKDQFMGINYLMNSEDFMGKQQNLLVFSNDKRHLYTAYDGGETSMFVFDTPYPGSIFNRREIGYGRLLAVSPDDKFLYTTAGGNNIYVYKIKDDGSITYKSYVYDSLLTGINSISVSPDNSYLYIMGMYNTSSAMVWYKKDIESGKLSTIRYTNLSINYDKFSFSPDGRFMYLSTISQPSFQWYEMNYKNGSILYRGSLSLMVRDFSITGEGSYLYLSTGGNMIEAYERNKNSGNLKYIDSATADMSVNSLLVSPDNEFLYALTGPAASGNIEWYPLRDSGKFSGHYVYFNGSVLIYPLKMDFTFGGRFLYVLCYNSFNIAVFQLGGK